MPSTCSTSLLDWGHAERPACKLVFKTSFSRLNPGSRGQATIISDPSEVSKTPTTNDQSDKLPTSSGPSFVSGRLGHQRRHWNRPRTYAYLAVKHTPGSLQINLLFTIFAEQAQTQNASCKLVFLQKTIFMAHAPKALRRGAKLLATRYRAVWLPYSTSSRSPIQAQRAVADRSARRPQRSIQEMRQREDQIWWSLTGSNR